ncbi:uncharacterized protein LOC117173188 [Belonocnema kinseyi]|uniref:uncharacterized protein LOC117173188 n=1 Tax=Belonocnema kinseyi TaxID=2817044 RepID=UPI00143D0620|nr:uncharacterized protein LOC117173188 [Belonocnema kinseyi]
MPPAQQKFNPNAVHAEGSTGNQKPRQKRRKSFLDPSSSSVQNVQQEIHIEENADIVIRLLDYNSGVGSIKSSGLQKDQLPHWLFTKVTSNFYEVYILDPNKDSWTGKAVYFKHDPKTNTAFGNNGTVPKPLDVFLIAPNESKLYSKLVPFQVLEGRRLFLPAENNRHHIFIKNTNGQVYKGKLRIPDREILSFNWALRYRQLAQIHNPQLS